ncbi:methylecgonone reductase-like [Punica granatum]|uniref:NADP-dependent oxidoreductase domain-containing protein n=2 Tax=Punica granatum TaxID=22663 RepID=A0A218VQ56_PUNGR|nr:methylecgonone reductase-like [Punica granatum]OWM62657.1 hypothetical protein CDL15_Pgr019951 [Punica granatum]PKI76708.1 hypothetical protein CRG98_002876 [Punica granatum]
MGEVGASRSAIPEVALNSGHKIPLIGLGTAAGPLPPPEALIAILVEAIEAGYRHFDTAAVYGSEESLGRAVAEALERQLIKSRDDLFITSKVWCTHTDPALVLPALKETLGRLGLEYVDLYLIHWPVRLKKETNKSNLTKESLLDFDVKGTWEAMEECSKLGLAKSIGVSNFGPKKLSHILQSCTIPPAVNQVEMHVAWRQEKLREYCKEKGIHVSAWSPLAANGASWGSKAVMDSLILKDIANARGTTVAQVALRWVYEQGASVIVKSFNKERMKDNLRIIEWEKQLTEEELEKINQIPPCQGVRGEMFVNESGPGYKSLDELWE